MGRSAADFNLPDVERDFIISPSAPPEIQDFVVELLWYLYSPDRGGQIDEYGMWDMGGCWLLTQALHEWMGPRSSLKWVIGRDLHKDDSTLPQHVILKVGDFYIDGNGLYTKEELIEFFEEDDFVQVSVKPFDPEEASELSVHCDLRKKKRLISDFHAEFGDGQDAAELAFL